MVVTANCSEKEVSLDSFYLMLETDCPNDGLAISEVARSPGYRKTAFSLILSAIAGSHPVSKELYRWQPVRLYSR
jgi:hypothetical protein